MTFRHIGLLLTSALVLIMLARQSAASELEIRWNWESTQGDPHSVSARFTPEQLDDGKDDSQLMSYTLSYPVQAIQAYMKPRLYFLTGMINELTGRHEQDRLQLEDLLHQKRSTPESELFWDAFYDYQEDAFLHFRLNPCRHPADRRKPCVRPDYSQLFYHYKYTMRPLATQLRSEQGLEMSIRNAQQWLITIPSRQEQQYHFYPPLSAIEANSADSDEKALLLATVVSELAPGASLYMVYPAASVGSVSPAWLAIQADSGVQGPRVMIANVEHVIIYGSAKLMEQMLYAHMELTSESLY